MKLKMPKLKYAIIGTAIAAAVWLIAINTSADTMIPIWIIPVGFIVGLLIKR